MASLTYKEMTAIIAAILIKLLINVADMWKTGSPMAIIVAELIRLLINLALMWSSHGYIRWVRNPMNFSTMLIEIAHLYLAYTFVRVVVYLLAVIVFNFPHILLSLHLNSLGVPTPIRFVW